MQPLVDLDELGEYSANEQTLGGCERCSQPYMPSGGLALQHAHETPCRNLLSIFPSDKEAGKQRVSDPFAPSRESPESAFAQPFEEPKPFESHPFSSWKNNYVHPEHNVQWDQTTFLENYCISLLSILHMLYGRCTSNNHSRFQKRFSIKEVDWYQHTRDVVTTKTAIVIVLC